MKVRITKKHIVLAFFGIIILACSFLVYKRFYSHKKAQIVKVVTSAGLQQKSNGRIAAIKLLEDYGPTTVGTPGRKKMVKDEFFNVIKSLGVEVPIPPIKIDRETSLENFGLTNEDVKEKPLVFLVGANKNFDSFKHGTNLQITEYARAHEGNVYVTETNKHNWKDIKEVKKGSEAKYNTGCVAKSTFKNHVIIHGVGIASPMIRELKIKNAEELLNLFADLYKTMINEARNENPACIVINLILPFASEGVFGDKSKFNENEFTDIVSLGLVKALLDLPTSDTRLILNQSF